MSNRVYISCAALASLVFVSLSWSRPENKPERNQTLIQHTVGPFASSDSASAATETREKFDPGRDAEKDIADAVAAAKQEHKKILLDVGGEWCSWCHKLDKFFQEHADASEYLHRNYIVVKVNYSKENKNTAVLSKYPPVKGYPHLFVLESNGTLLHSQDTGELESGDHHDYDKVMNFLKKWAPKGDS
jgi:thioredoxin-related protein